MINISEELDALNFVHLRVHSEYSLVDGINRIQSLVEAAVKFKMPALALTDQTNLFACVKFYRAARAAGLKPIIGVDLPFVSSRSPDEICQLTLLCQDVAGYQNLTRLVSRCYLEGQQTETEMIPHAQAHWFTERACEGLIAISGGLRGDIGKKLLQNKSEHAQMTVKFWQQIFPSRFYLSISRVNAPQEDKHNQATLLLARELRIPMVATNDVCFLKAEDFIVHEARVCIHEGLLLDDAKRPRIYTEQQYLRSTQEMAALFTTLPSVLTNTVEIAKRCNLVLELSTVYLPDFPVPPTFTIEQYLRTTAQQGLEQRFKALQLIEKSEQQRYEERLKIELDVIVSMGFSGYFLIVADFIAWAKQQGIPVGPGRGSGAGSLVAYALAITDLDPLPYKLLFERFLNPERVSMPDFDIDFCMQRRDEVIAYVMQKYGRDCVSQIITYGTMAAKVVVRDVGRVLGHPYGFVDDIAKRIPFELGITLTKALQQEETLAERYQNEEEVKTLLDLAMRLEGITRNVGKHAGGVVIAPSALTDFTPIYCEPGKDSLVSQFDKDDVEKVGLVKFDFLGLSTLTIIDWALDNIEKLNLVLGKSESRIDLTQISLQDKKTFDLLKACATTAIFQLESRGMKELIQRLQPDCFEDIIALVALFRPGPLQSGMVDDFINRKHGLASVEYLHESLEPLLKPTYGVIVYQEQVMQIAQVLAGYSLGAADLLRRAMGKKKAEEMSKQRQIFVTQASTRGVTDAIATSIFDLMEKFADYGFNKSHSAAYALLAYQTAWLKAHHPECFMAAVLSAAMDNTEKVVHFIEDCRELGLVVIAPHINFSQYAFSVSKEKEIIYGLGALKGLGQAAIELIIEEREAHGLFSNLFDLCGRVDLRKVNKRGLEALIFSGALDDLGANRATMLASLPVAMQFAEQQSKNLQTGQQDLFGFAPKKQENSRQDLHFMQTQPWSLQYRLAQEKAILGMYVSGHPFSIYQQEFRTLLRYSLAKLDKINNVALLIAGLCVDVRTLFTKNQDKMAIVTLEDSSGRFELPFFPESFRRYGGLLKKDDLLMIECEPSIDRYSQRRRFQLNAVYDLTNARVRFGHSLQLKINLDKFDQHLLNKLIAILMQFMHGQMPIIFVFCLFEESTLKKKEGNDLPAKTDPLPQSDVRMCCSQAWKVVPNEECLGQLRALLGEDHVSINYH